MSTRGRRGLVGLVALAMLLLGGCSFDPAYTPVAAGDAGGRHWTLLAVRHFAGGRGCELHSQGQLVAGYCSNTYKGTYHAGFADLPGTQEGVAYGRIPDGVATVVHTPSGRRAATVAVAGFPGRWFALAVHGETPVLLTWAPTARWHLRFLDAAGHDADPRS
ncbi:MAG TPA: hypothetical protein VF486_17820 [Actinomycetes bacterium]